MKNNRMQLKEITFQSLCLVVVGLMIQPASASNMRGSNSYLQELDNSKEINNHFNYFFQKSLDEKRDLVQSQNIPILDKRYQAQSYLLQLPQINAHQIQTQPPCDLNNKTLYSFRPEEEFRYPIKQPFPQAVNDAYCLLQRTFQSLKGDDLRAIAPITANNELYNQIKNELTDIKNDTLVVVVPGIFGEFIDQLGFGEVFGKGLAELDNPKFRSSFAEKFENYIKNSKSPQDLSLFKDQRFLMKNLRGYYKNSLKNEAQKYSTVDINKWIKVSSLDNSEGKPLFKIALLGLEPMSLESIQEQTNLAIIYLRRLNKFMELYPKMNDGKLPSKIILVGYSRGTPVAYEMLTILKDGANLQDALPHTSKEETQKKRIEIEALKTKGATWANRIKAMVSLGGVSLGTSLADASTIFRDNAPDNVKILQAFKRLMFNLKIINQEDVHALSAAYQLHQNSNSTRVDIKNKTIILSVSKETSQSIHTFTQKISENLKLFNEFLSVVKNLDTTQNSKKIIKGIEAAKKISDFYADIGNAVQALSSGNKRDGIKDLVQALNQNVKISELSTLANDLIEAGLTLFPQIAEVSHSISNANKEMKSQATIIPASIQNQLQHPFTQLMLDNYGFNDTKNNWSKALKDKDFLALIYEFNFSIEKFQHFFQQAWSGASELGTLPRLNWLMHNAKRLPTNVHYYSINAILNDPQSTYYQEGLSYGFNHSQDETFLNKSWRDLMNVGMLDPINNTYKDGLDFTFSGSAWNDSQVDWYKTLLWPTIIKAFTGDSQSSPQFNAKVLGILRTHHWGLALPFAARESTTQNPITGEDISPLAVANVNPVPRAELLKAIIMAVHKDISLNSHLLQP